jgi:hypothetical protein
MWPSQHVLIHAEMECTLNIQGALLVQGTCDESRRGCGTQLVLVKKCVTKTVRPLTSLSVEGTHFFA